MDIARDGLGALTLFVEDLDAATAFYRDVLELHAVYEDDVSTVFRLGSPLLNVLALSAAAELVDPSRWLPPGASGELCSACGSRTPTLPALTSRARESRC